KPRRESCESRFHRRNKRLASLARLAPDEYCPGVKLAQIAFVIRQQSESAKTSDKFRASIGHARARTRYQNNATRAARKFFANPIVVTFFCRIKPDCHLKVCWLALWKCRRTADTTVSNDGFSSQFTKLPLEFFRFAGTDHEEPAMLEFPRNDPRKIRTDGMDVRWQHADIILVEARRRQIYPAAPPLRYCQFRNARLCRLPSLSRGVGYCLCAAIAISVCCWPIPRLLHLARFREISAPGRTQCCYCVCR